MPEQYSSTANNGKEKILFQFLGVCLWVVGIFTILNYFVYQHALCYILAGLAVIIFLLRYLFVSKKISYTTCASLLCIVTVFYIVPLSAYFSGGLFSPITPWLVIIPLGSILLFGVDKKVFIFTAFSLVLLIMLTVLAAINYNFPSFSTDLSYFGFSASIAGLLLLVFFLTWLFEKQNKNALLSLKVEKDLFLKHASQLPGVIYQFQLFNNGEARCNFISSGAKDMLGIHPEKVKDNLQLVFDMFHPDDFAVLQKSLLQSCKTLQKWAYEARLLIPGREIIHIKGSARPERQADDSTVWYGYVYDITEEKKAAQALTESQLNFKQISDTINDVFYLYDIINKKYLFISPNCKTVLGADDIFFYSGDSYTRRHVFEGDKELLLNANAKVNGGETYEIEFRIVIDGQMRWIQEKSFPIKDSAGNTIKNSGMLRDITERKLVQQKLIESQNYVKQITSTINDIFYLYDNIEKKYLFVSPNCGSILGVPDTFFYEGKDFTGHFVHNDDKKKLLLALENISASMKYDEDFRVIINGQMKWVNEKAYAIKDDNGGVVKISGILTDVTARKIAEEKLIKSQRGFEEAQELAHIGSWEYNFDTAFTEWSKETYRIFEMDAMPGDKAIEAFRNKIHPDDLKTVEAGIEDMNKKGGIGTLEFRIVGNNGQIKYLLSIAETFLSENDNKIAGMKGTLQDITKQRLAAMAKSNFLSTMSHEIRTPINGVIGLSNLLMEEELTPVQKEYVHTLNFSAQHLSAVVSDILDFSKIESGNFTFEKVSFNMEQVCLNIFKLFETQAAEKNIEYKFVPHPIQEYSMYGDYVRLSQVLTNLLSNAVKFTHKGGVEFSYKPLAQTGETLTLQFRIKDTGIGITGVQQKRIFESFLQADDSVTRKYGGTGLGLTISKKLVELQGGKIYLESVHGKGSVFTVELAFDKHSYASNAIVAKAAGEDVDKTSLKGMKILVAEDNKVNAMVLTRFLKKWDIESHVVEDGQQAVDSITTDRFDVVLMDLQMPVMDGRTATNTIRQLANPAYSTIPVIALTADALIDSQRALLRNGFNDCITKPFSPEALFKLLKKYYTN